MDISDIELMESLPIGILVESNVKNLDRLQHNFVLSGIDFETCVTLPCVTEVVRFSPIKIIIADFKFHGGTIFDIIKLSTKSEKYFPVVMWTKNQTQLPDDFLEKTGITAAVNKELPFDDILNLVKKIMQKK